MASCKTVAMASGAAACLSGVAGFVAPSAPQLRASQAVVGEATPAMAQSSSTGATTSAMAFAAVSVAAVGSAHSRRSKRRTACCSVVTTDSEGRDRFVAAGGATPTITRKQEKGSLGVIRLDYNYPPSPGDIDSPDSFGYDVYYRAVPGFTFEMAQIGKMTPEVEKEFIEAIDYFDKKGVSGITGDCGFMMYFQELARNHTNKPVFMSSLAQLPAVTCAFNKKELIAIFTANGERLKPMRSVIKDECGVDPEDTRYIIVGCEDVDGFEAVADGTKVDIAKCTPGIVKKAQEVVKKYPNLRAFMFECTELPPFSDSVRAATGLPVYDAITSCNSMLAGFNDNPLFGRDNWQEGWDGEQEGYAFGQNLTDEDRAKLEN